MKRLLIFLFACMAVRLFAAGPATEVRLGNITVGTPFYATNYLVGVTDTGSNGFGRLYSPADISAIIGGGGGGGSASNAVTRVNGMTNAQQVLLVRTNATASVPSISTNGAGGIGTNFFDFPYAGAAVSGVLNSNDWRKIAPLQNANQGYDANTNTGNYGVILGGATNRSEGPFNVIGGGRNNQILGSDLTNAVSVIAGGEDNQMPLGNNKHAVIGGGQSNRVENARYSGILSGWVNMIGPSMSASNSVICGGFKNTNNAWNSFLGGGYTNQIQEVANDFVANVLVGGGFNYLKGSYSVIAGGSQNIITNVGHGIGDGEGCFIGAGRWNFIYGNRNSIVGGITNRIINDSTTSSILGGSANVIDGGGSSAIAGGSANYVFSDHGFIGGGNGNQINGGAFAFIGHGNLNYIGLGSDYSSIVGGQNNRIEDFTTDASIIGSGLTNNVSSSVDIGVKNATKFTVDATAATVRGTLVGSGGANITGGITNAALTASRFTLTDSNKRLISSAAAVDDTEFGYLDGVTSPIQNQLASKQTGSLSLSNWVNSGVITNVKSASTAFTHLTNGNANGNASIKSLSASGSITLTDQGTNVVIGSAAGGGNVVGAPSSTAFTLIPYADTSGALLTNSSIATDSQRTNLFTPGYDNAYRLRATNGVDDLGWMHVAGKQTNDSTFYGADAQFSGAVTFQDGITVALASTFSSDLIHGGPVQYTTATITGTDIDWAVNSARYKQLTGNTTFTFSNLVDDRHVWVELQQDSTGTRTATWPTVTWLAHTNQSGTLTAGGVNTNASFITVFHFWRRSGTVYGEVTSTAASRFDVEWSNGTVPSSDVAARVSDETGTDKLVFSSNSELSGTTRAAALIATNLSQFGSANVTTNLNAGAETVTNLLQAGSANITTNLNANNVTVSNTLQGLGSGDNYINKLLVTNDLRVQVGANTVASNAWVGGTTFVDNTAYTNKLGDAALTNAAALVVKAFMLTNLYDQVEIWASGSAQMSTATTNQILFKYASDTILDTGLQGASNTAWRAQCTITRTGASAQKYALSLWWGGNTFQLTNVTSSGANANGSDQTFQIQLASRKPGGITNDFLHAKYYPAPH